MNIYERGVLELLKEFTFGVTHCDGFRTTNEEVAFEVVKDEITKAFYDECIETLVDEGFARWSGKWLNIKMENKDGN